jgi:PilZ domain-containing protein
MAERQITDAKNLVAEVSALGAAMRERRRHDRQPLPWTATIEVRGKRFEGTIVDLSPGGARLRFDAAVSQGDELTLVLKELDGLGGRVVWQREGEAGIQFMLAPEEVTARVESKMGLDLRQRRAGRAPSPPPPSMPEVLPSTGRRTGRLRLLALAGSAAAVLVVGTLVVAGSEEEGIKQAFAITGGAVGQHECSNRLDKLAGSTNQIDFSLNVASAAQSKCLDLKHIGGGETDPRGHMVQATKVRPIEKAGTH